ncbi:DNA polymerase III subunit gamma and tau [Nocardioides sp. Iso805N]|uniref:DNA polymerase III subunit gamma and tau n=1 Tax=Nocardioides sp. Iso805N TaxID=1283287 RepID=UPI00036A3160|nr:DNA polymerase III subunit gamma and tau [Nocardioides sp. Iso805N]
MDSVGSSGAGSPGPLALYRRYRPETFAEVIGQEHVTTPLRAALANNRVNHAYLFSGPRGCGKTTSARILARTLNCEKAPIADPCGECDSCRDLARGGPGSIDVIEIDAASHGGVDDARDLREKAFFAPVRSRYKVYIIDEAHMVSTQGFNALLKLVEEPPEHLRFIFATTEPEKVIATIRSRTHHYPFRLIPPRLLTAYLSELCEKEQVRVEPAALPLVVRAGGGSARDTLSVMDQLLGGAGPEGVTYDLAAGLLGYTPDSLLDEVIDAFAAGDGAAVFGVVDKVIETGQDPRRFTEDLLRRLRDLVIVSAVPDAPATGLIDVAEDAGERLVAQATRFGAHDLSRAADLVATGLTEMRGATAPRLLLELICARVLLPGADHGVDGLAARLDRVERRLSVTGVPTPAPAAPAAPPAQDRPVLRPSVGAPSDEQVRPAAQAAPAARPAQPVASSEPASRPSPPQPAPPAATEPAPAPAQQPAPVHQPAAAPAAAAPAAPPASSGSSGSSGGMSVVDARRLWPEVVSKLSQLRKATWTLVSHNAQVMGLEGDVLTIGFATQGLREQFTRGNHEPPLKQAITDAIGASWRIEAIVDQGTAPGGAVPQTQQAQAQHGPQAQQAQAPAPTPQTAPEPPPWDDHGVPPEPDEAPQPSAQDAPPPWDEPGQAVGQAAQPTSSYDASRAAREAIQPTRVGSGVPDHAEEQSRAAAELAARDADVRPDDQPFEEDQLGGAELLQRELGAQIIEEIRHQ